MSRNSVRKLLKKHDYVKRKALKKKAAGGYVNRNAQFERIKTLWKDYETAGNPSSVLIPRKRNSLATSIERGDCTYARPLKSAVTTFRP